MSKRTGALLASLGVIAVAGCGTEASPEAAGETARPDTARATIYFLTDGGRVSLAVRRTVDLVPPEQGSRVRAAVTALLAGPTEAERGSGVTTAIPPLAALIEVSFRGYGGTGAVIDLAGLPASADAVTIVRILTQVARTVIGGSGVSRVWVRSSGEPWDLPTMAGVVLDRPIDYETLLGFYGICDAKPGTEAVSGDCFTALP